MKQTTQLRLYVKPRWVDCLGLIFGCICPCQSMSGDGDSSEWPIWVSHWTTRNTTVSSGASLRLQTFEEKYHHHYTLNENMCLFLPPAQIVRRYSMCYIPPGFWPRLVARLIAFPKRALRILRDQVILQHSHVIVKWSHLILKCSHVIPYDLLLEWLYYMNAFGDHMTQSLIS